MSISDEINELALGVEESTKVPKKQKVNHSCAKAPPGFLNVQEFADALGMSRSQMYRLISEGSLPPPVQISESRSVWKATDASDYLDACVAKRDAQWRKPA